MGGWATKKFGRFQRSTCLIVAWVDNWQAQPPFNGSVDVPSIED
jgi:hypothetical protein